MLNMIAEDLAKREIPQDAILADIAKVLIVDDNSFDRRRLTRECRKLDLNLIVEEVDSYAAMKDALDNDRYDVIFLDYRLNDGDGIQALDYIRSHMANMHAAPIMVVGNPQADIAVSAMRKGCFDYIAKSKVNGADLGNAIKAALRRSRLDAEQSRNAGLNAKLTQILDRLSRDTATEMKPLLSRMMRNIRGEIAANGANASGVVHHLQNDCMELWTKIERLEHFAERMGEDRGDTVPHIPKF